MRSIPFCRVLAFVLLLAPAGCRAQESSPELNVCYGKADDRELVLDVFRPPQTANAALHPAIILIHGGGWTGGDKKDMQDLGKGAARLGFVAFSINYRLSTETGNHWPAQLDDAQRAVRWVRANSAKYAVDPARIGALGSSAGGHLVTFLGTSDTRDNSDPALADFSSRVSCVVDMAGPTDLTDNFAPKVKLGAYSNDLVRRLLGGKPADLGQVAHDASPLFRVDGKAAPFLIFQGKLDELVPPDQAERLDSALHAAGVESKLIMFPQAGHGLNRKEDADRFIAETAEFLKSHLRP